jgi:hypothetical protein
MPLYTFFTQFAECTSTDFKYDGIVRSRTQTMEFVVCLLGLQKRNSCNFRQFVVMVTRNCVISKPSLTFVYRNWLSVTYRRLHRPSHGMVQIGKLAAIAGTERHCRDKRSVSRVPYCECMHVPHCTWYHQAPRSSFKMNPLQPAALCWLVQICEILLLVTNSCCSASYKNLEGYVLMFKLTRNSSRLRKVLL